MLNLKNTIKCFISFISDLLPSWFLSPTEEKLECNSLSAQEDSFLKNWTLELLHCSPCTPSLQTVQVKLLLWQCPHQTHSCTHFARAASTDFRGFFCELWCTVYEHLMVTHHFYKHNYPTTQDKWNGPPIGDLFFHKHPKYFVLRISTWSHSLETPLSSPLFHITLRLKDLHHLTDVTSSDIQNSMRGNWYALENKKKIVFSNRESLEKQNILMWRLHAR